MTTKTSVKNKAPSQPDIADVGYQLESFAKPSASDLRSLEQSKPSCGNGDICVRRYRYTCELIEEPIEVLAARLQDLWDNATNHHHVQPLRTAAAKLGITLAGEAGDKVRKERAGT